MIVGDVVMYSRKQQEFTARFGGKTAQAFHDCAFLKKMVISALWYRLRNGDTWVLLF